MAAAAPHWAARRVVGRVPWHPALHRRLVPFRNSAAWGEKWQSAQPERFSEATAVERACELACIPARLPRKRCFCWSPRRVHRVRQQSVRAVQLTVRQDQDLRGRFSAHGPRRREETNRPVLEIVNRRCVRNCAREPDAFSRPRALCPPRAPLAPRPRVDRHRAVHEMVDYTTPECVDKKDTTPQLRSVLLPDPRGVNRLQDDDMHCLPRDGCEERRLDLNHDLPANRVFGVRVTASWLRHVAHGNTSWTRPLIVAVADP